MGLRYVGAVALGKQKHNVNKDSCKSHHILMELLVFCFFFLFFFPAKLHVFTAEEATITSVHKIQALREPVVDRFWTCGTGS